MTDHSAISAPSRPSFAVPWGLPEALGALALAFLIYLVGTTGLSIGAHSLYVHHTLAFSLLAYQFLTAGVVLSAALLMLYRFHRDPEVLGYRFPGWRALGIAVLSLPAVFVAIALIVAFFNAFLPGYHLQGNARQLLVNPHQHVGTIEQLAVFVVFAIQAPFTEETLFRGMLFQGVRHFFTRFCSPPVATAAGAVISGCIFGLAHFEPHTLPILIFLGIMLALIFHFGRSIYASVLVHAVVNALAVVQIFHPL